KESKKSLVELGMRPNDFEGVKKGGEGLPKKGWVVEIRGHTAHGGGHNFIVDTLVENLASQWLAHFEQAVPRGPLENPYWRLVSAVPVTIKDKKDPEKARPGVDVTLFNRLDRAQPGEVVLEVKFDDVKGKFIRLEPIRQDGPVPPGRELKQRVAFASEGEAGKKIVAVRQVLPWEDSVAKRVRCAVLYAYKLDDAPHAGVFKLINTSHLSEVMADGGAVGGAVKAGGGGPPAMRP